MTAPDKPPERCSAVLFATIATAESSAGKNIPGWKTLEEELARAHNLNYELRKLILRFGSHGLKRRMELEVAKVNRQAMRKSNEPT